MSTRERKKDALDQFEALGFEFVSKGAQGIGPCPYCGGKKFFVNAAKSTWDCKTCFKKGNLTTYMTERVRVWHRNTTAAAWETAAKDRRLPVAALKYARIGHNPDNDVYYFPVRGETDFCPDLRRWTVGGPVMSIPLCKMGLLGLDDLVEANGDDERKGVPVWVCEGEWDWVAWRYLIKMAGLRDVVVGKPGATTFKEEWVPHFRGREVYSLDDNDKAGRQGGLKTEKMLSGVARRLHFVHWPDGTPDKWDTRDAVIKWDRMGRPPGDCVKLMKKRCQPRPMGAEGDAPAAGPAGTAPPQEPARPRPEVLPNFEQTAAVFAEWTRFGQSERDALAVLLATALSVQVPGDPLWTQLIAPPGGGKTLLLNAFKASERCVFRSTLTPASLVSGYKDNKSVPDPSLLPRLNGKCAVFKDATELLAMPLAERNMVWSTLRGAYDGNIDRGYGNGVERVYNVQFSMLWGITPAIYGDNQAMMGERFVRFNLVMGDDAVQEQRDLVRAALTNVGREDKMVEALIGAVTDHLWRDVDVEKLVQPSDKDVERIISYASLVSKLRAKVERQMFGEKLPLYRPSPEVPTRLAKVAKKLGMMLCFVLEREAWDADVWRVLERAMLDSAAGFNLDIVAAVMEQGGSCDRTALSARLHLPRETLRAAVADLELLGVVVPGGSVATGGRSKELVALHADFQSDWRRADVKDYTFIERELALRAQRAERYKRKEKKREP